MNTHLEKPIERVSQREIKNRRIELKKMIEALLFASQEPLSIERLKAIAEQFFSPTILEIKAILEQLQEEYLSGGRAFSLDKIAEGYLLRTTPSVKTYVELLFEPKEVKLSKAATETLAIIAYKQPITRPQIEAIRGVDSSGSIISLLERGLIQTAGKLDTIGRPTLYKTTHRFLSYYGLSSLEDLYIVD